MKLGKFELDNLVSEKRILTLTSISGVYETYHFIPVGDGNIFGQIGDNQLGVEWMGHSLNDRTRLSAALLSSNDGKVGLPNGSQLLQRVLCRQPGIRSGQAGGAAHRRLRHGGTGADDLLSHTGGVTGRGHQSERSRQQEHSVARASSDFSISASLDFQVVTQHGSDNAWFGAGFGQGPPGPNNVPGRRFRPARERRPGTATWWKLTTFTVRS